MPTLPKKKQRTTSWSKSYPSEIELKKQNQDQILIVKFFVEVIQSVR